MGWCHLASHAEGPTCTQVVAFCLIAASSRATLMGTGEGVEVSPLFEFEVSTDSLATKDKVEAQTTLTGYSDFLQRGAVRLIFVAPDNVHNGFVVVDQGADPPPPG